MALTNVANFALKSTDKWTLGFTAVVVFSVDILLAKCDFLIKFKRFLPAKQARDIL